MTLLYSLLDDPLIRIRRASDGQTNLVSLPDLFVMLLADEVRDFPALRPHQRHPWYAFLVQLAAIAMHRADVDKPFTTASDWREALLMLTPEDPDGAAWCLVSPPDRPALLQAPVPDWNPQDWETVLHAPDALDMLGTSKNHDLKTARMRLAEPEDWLFALISLQTQEGSNSGSYKGISRMNSGYGSRPAVGVVPKGYTGRRWSRDIGVLLQARQDVATKNELQTVNGLALVWLAAWDGEAAISIANLDPYYIEICRRVRFLMSDRGRIFARRAKTPNARIGESAVRKGITGDPWAPVDTTDAKVLTIKVTGFDYKLMSELLVPGKYAYSIAQVVRGSDGEQLALLAQAVARGQSKTEGYHERRIPISPRTRMLLQTQQIELLGKLARRRVEAIGEIRKLVWGALCLLFNNGNSSKNSSDGVKERASRYAQAIERTEDQRFFDDLAQEAEANDPEAEHLNWLVGLAQRSEKVLCAAFVAGPRSGMQRYRAQSAALNRFHGALRGDNSPLPILAGHYRQLANETANKDPQRETPDA